MSTVIAPPHGGVFVDWEQHRIYFDNSTRSTFQVCKQKANLGNVQGYQPVNRMDESPLDFGHAFHAAVAAYYDHAAGGFFDDDMMWCTFPTPGPSAVRTAQAAFMYDLKKQGSNLPVEIESAERRSLERGVALVEAYVERWAREPYENIIRPDGSPLTELYFEIPIARWGEWDIYFCGTIDRIMKHIMTGRPRIFETKTTTQGLSQYIQQRKPNQQIDSYFKIAWAYMAKHFPDLPVITDAVWDCTFVSKRAPDTSKSLKQRFWIWGIDISADFARQETSRSQRDIERFMIDLESDAIEFAKWLMSGAEWWPHSTHGTACHLFGGCPFRGFCSTDNVREILTTFFEIKTWNPRKKLRA